MKATITKRRQRRRQRDGSFKTYDRYVLNYRCPKTGQRHQQFFEKQKEAQAAQRDLFVQFENGLYATGRQHPTVAEAFDAWLDSSRHNTKLSTRKGYEAYRSYIVGPLLVGTREQRAEYTMTGKVPQGCKLTPMLGKVRITELTTADIRAWNTGLAEAVGAYSAMKAFQRLKAMLNLAGEDHNIRPPAMPQRIGRGKRKEKKTILTPLQVQRLLQHCRSDLDYGLYIAWPFLTGTRPSEQLALRWEDIDFDKKVIHIRRMLEKDGAVTNFTKTEAGMREIPMVSVLREQLLEWKLPCPRKVGELGFVFPSQGARQAWPKRKIGGGVLLYSNFRQRVWKRAFATLADDGIPYVTPHSARHSFISTLQAQGVEVGLVAKFAGHSDPSVTLSHYTQAVRGGAEAIEQLAVAYHAL